MSRQRILISCVLILILGAGFFYLIKGNKTETNRNVKSEMGLYALNVSPQTPQDTVIVDSITMQEDGYVVVRVTDGMRLGQIIEPSKLLKKGKYKNVEIPLGNFYNGEDLILIIHKDDGNGYFNDLDQPAVNADGTFTARYVKTGEAVSNTVLQLSQESMAGHSMGNIVTVRYTNSGYEPSSLEVSVGTTVQFVNESDANMWVASNIHPGHDLLPTFDQFSPGKKGTSYTYVFDKLGIWPYHDHINPSLEGVITVIK